MADEKGKGPVNGLSKLPSEYDDIHTDLIASLESIQMGSKATSPEERIHRAGKRASDQIATLSKISNINSITTTMSRTGEYMMGARVPNNPYVDMPTETIEKMIREGQKDVSIKSRQISGYMSDLDRDNPYPAQLKDLKAQAGQGYDQVAQLKAALKVQRQRGLSTEQIYRSSEEFIENQQAKIGGRELKNKVSELARSGELGSAEEEFGKFKESLEKVKESFDEWADASAASVAASEDLTRAKQKVAELEQDLANAKKDERDAIQQQLDKAKTSQQKLESAQGDLADSLKEKKAQLDKATEESQEAEARSGAAGGAAGLRLNKVRSGIAMLSAATSAASTIALEQEFEQMNLRTAYAGIVNRQYRDQDAMAKGDMSAFLRLANSDAIAKAYADNMGRTAVGLKGTEAFVKGLDAATLGVAAVGEGAALDAGGSVEMGAKSFALAADVAVQTSRIAKGLTKGGYGYQGYQTTMNFLNTVQEIGADTMQSYFDYKTGTYAAGTGLGGNRAKFMADMSSDVSKFTALGIDPTEALQLAQTGVQAFGGKGNMSQLVQRAGVAELKGIMTRGQFVQGAGALAGVGGGVDDLESIMSKAVAAGMDNAKNVQQMVAATTQLAAAGGASGFGVVGATENILTSSVQNLMAMGADPNLATGAAASAMMNASNAAAMKGTFADLQYRAKTEGIYGPMDVNTSGALANLTPEQIQTLQRGDEKAYQMAKSMGLAGTLGLKEGGGFKEGFGEKMQSLFDAKVGKTAGDMVGLGYYGDATIQNQIDSVLSGKLKADDPSISDKARSAYFNMTGQVLGSVAFGGARKDAGGLTEAEKKAGMSLPEFMRYGTGEEGAVQTFRRQGAQREGVKIGTGEDKFGEMGGLAGVVAAMGEILKTSPKQMEEAAANAAKKLEAPGKLYKEGSDTFKAAVNQFVTHVEKVTGEKVVSSVKSTPKVRDIGTVVDEKGIIRPGPGFKG